VLHYNVLRQWAFSAPAALCQELLRSLLCVVILKR